MTDRRGVSPALLRRLSEEDESLLEGRGPEIDRLMVERLYQTSWPLRYVPYPMLFGAFLVFRDYADWWSILGLTALYTLGTAYLDRQRNMMRDLGGDFGDPGPWARRFMIGSGITGLTWGILGVLYFPSQNLPLQAVMAVAWAGLAFTSMNARALHLPSYYAFLLAMSLPVYVRTFLSGELPAIYMTLLGLVLGVAMTLTAHGSNRRERLGFALRLRNAELIGELDRARAEADSGRQTAEASYRAVLGEFTAAQQMAQHGSWAWDAGSEATTWSDEFYRLVGLEPQSCPAALAALLDQVEADDRDAVRAHVQRLRAGAAQDSVRFHLKDGGRRELVGQAQTDGRGQTQRILGMLRPVPDAA